MKSLQMFKRLFLGLLMTLAASSYVQAGVVTIWGEEGWGSIKIPMNDFYNSLAGHSSTIAADAFLNTVNLASTNLLWITQPADDYTAAELNTMKSFISAGGRIAFLGEHGTIAPPQNNRINTALSFLGCNITINNVALDAGSRTASVADGQILSHPLTAGVNTYFYACFAPLIISGTAQALMVGEEPYLSNPSIMMGYQNVGAGSVFVITDQNVWTNAPTGWPGGFNNARMFENLLSGNTAVNAPTTNPVFVSNLISLTPTINWTYSDVERDIQQKYEVEVWTGPYGTGTRMWDPPIGTGTISSVVYAGSPLTASVLYYARVRASDTTWGNFSEATFTIPSGNAPPTTNPVTISNPGNPTPTIGWTYRDPDGNPQVQYEVEVWTGPNGTGTSMWDPAAGTGTTSGALYAGLSLTNSRTYYARVKAFDGTIWGGWSEVSWIAIIDILPVAEAGPDQNVQAGALCNASVTLNGTSSNDPDGGAIVTYTWNGTGGPWTGATPVVTLPVGRNKITLTVVDNEGSRASDSVIITVTDKLAPVPTVGTLPQIDGICSVTLSPPTAMDNCTGLITATTSSPLSITTQGTKTILWTYTDLNGNASTQTQTVIVKDTTTPVPKITLLPVIKAECSITVSTPPEALDGCGGTVTAATSDPLIYTTQGTYEILWVYDNGNGKTANQQQTVIVDDTTKPVAEISSLPVLRGDCSVELAIPYATDNCAGRIAGSTPGSLSLHNQGTFTIVWSYDDRNGNVLTQNQTVIIKDSNAPVLTKNGSDTVVIVKESVNSTTLHTNSATAMDNCTGTTIRTSRSDGLPLDTSFFEGITKITWTACDTNGNCDSVARTVTVKRNSAPVLVMPSDTSMLEGQLITLNILTSDRDGTFPDIFMENCPVPHSLTDNKNGTATIEFRPGCTDHGIYTIKVSATDKIDTVQKVFTLTIIDVNFDPVFDTTSHYLAREMQNFNTTFRVYDCDGTIPEIRIVNTPPGASFVDNHNGTATMLWTPDADDNGYYVIVFEAKDTHITIRDTIILEVKDMNAYPPVLTLSTIDTTCPFNQLLVIYAKALDLDGTPPIIKATGIPSGASLNDDNEGNALFTWTPRDTGIFTFTVTARDLVDSTSFVSRMITIRVTNANVFGPIFTPHPDAVIDQNQRMELKIVAVDPDGTIPILTFIAKPQGSVFTDNKDGSGTIFWVPECDVSGTFAFTTVATDGHFSDTMTTTVIVRDVNCAPVLYRITDLNAQLGEYIKFKVRAYDPDNDNTALFLSASCNLQGYTFETKNDGSGVFGWQANYSSGSYPVKFYVSDGQLTDSTEMHINVNKTGSVKISGYPQGVKIYAMPSGSYNGEYLGNDSVVFSALPGTYSFQMLSTGHRPQRFSCNILADTVLNVFRTLKPSIPLMLAPAETLVTQSGRLTIDGPFSLADLNGDGMLDITSWTEKGLSFHPGTDTGSLIFQSNVISITDSIKNIKPFYHLFVDWNNDKKYDCLYSDHLGNILIINLKDQSVDTILKIPGARIYPIAYDVNNDHKKDLVIHSEGKGVFVYINTGSDANPAFQSATECTDYSGASLISMQGPFALVDIDGDGSDEFIVHENGVLRIFKISGKLDMLTLSEDLNCAGKRYTTDSSNIFTLVSAQGMPGLVVRNGDKLRVYFTRLKGDINGDRKVDIRDIVIISKNLEITDSDSNWNPLCNLKLSTTGSEIIDIKDVTHAGKCWELQE